MLAAGAASRAGPFASRARVSWIHTSRRVESSKSTKLRIEPESSPKPRTVAPNVAFAGLEFLTSGSALIGVLRKKQVAYRTKDSKNKMNVAEDRTLARSEIQWIVDHVCGKVSLKKQATLELTREQRRSLIHLATQMTRKDVPLSYLIGTMPFGSLPKPLIVRKPVLIPRPETEHWATEAAKSIVARLKASSSRSSSLRVADLCTGSGCVALLVAHILRTEIGEDGWTIVACDRSPEAVKLAQENRDMLGFTDKQVKVFQSDLFSNGDMKELCQHAGGPFDVVLSNPPYITVREWEKLPPSVKLYEDPIALIGEEHARQYVEQVESMESDSSRKDMNGLAFHRQLAKIVFSPWFSTLSSPARDVPSPTTPRLFVAEYGKGQHGLAHGIYSARVPPVQRTPTIVRLPEQLFICGVGNARTHPLTRHSIGQVVLDPLLKKLVDLDHSERQRVLQFLSNLRGLKQKVLGSTVKDASDEVEVAQHKAWDASISDDIPLVQVVRNERGSGQGSFSLAEQRKLAFYPRTDYQPVVLDGSYQKPTGHPSELTATKRLDKGGWQATLPILVPSSTDSSVIYQIDVVLYKPSVAMNLSGISLKAFLESQPQGRKAVSATDNILVLQDELDLEFGDVKKRDKGSARGHNGIRDIFTRLKISDAAGGQKLTRLRIGIGRPSSNKQSSVTSRKSNYKGKGDPLMFDWVLSPLRDAEMESLCEGSVLDKVADSTFHWIRERVKILAPDTNALHQQPEFVDHLSIANRKDQFGVNRYIWIEK